MKNEKKGNKHKEYMYITLSLTPRQKPTKMGIYSNGKIFGLRIYHFTEDDIGNTLFEEKQDETMTHAQMREAYLFYTELNNKSEIHFEYYTECSSTYREGLFLKWCQMSLNLFLEKFGI